MKLDIFLKLQNQNLRSYSLNGVIFMVPNVLEVLGESHGLSIWEQAPCAGTNLFLEFP